MRAMLALLMRDLRLAIRHGGESLMPLVFLFAVIILVPLGVGPGPNLLATIAPGMIWVAALLASLLALENLFRPDHEDGTLEQWWLGHLPVTGLVICRLFSHWLVTGVPVILFAPLAAQMLYLPSQSLSVLMISLLIGTPILSLVGGLAAALTLGTNRGSVLLPILVFPLVVPVLIFATGAVTAAADDLPVRANLGLMLALLVLAITLVPMAATAALRLNIE
ncbi:MAG: heme exporter protein CcmB [Wenzhouxiangella sp.]